LRSGESCCMRLMGLIGGREYLVNQCQQARSTLGLPRDYREIHLGLQK
jgi:hypothetical protein